VLCCAALSLLCAVRSAPFVALKAMPSGDLGITPYQTDSLTGPTVEFELEASTPRNHNNSSSSSSGYNCTIIVSAKAITSGQYSFYRDPAAEQILGTEPAPGRDSFLQDQDCLTACDYDGG
jgi:hypothetical protein